jgi:hypothetical protein
MMHRLESLGIMNEARVEQWLGSETLVGEGCWQVCVGL